MWVSEDRAQVGKGSHCIQSDPIVLGSQSNSTDPELIAHSDPNRQHSQNAYQNSLTPRAH